jgi:hypothetical protein
MSCVCLITKPILSTRYLHHFDNHVRRYYMLRVIKSLHSGFSTAQQERLMQRIARDRDSLELFTTALLSVSAEWYW